MYPFEQLRPTSFIQLICLFLLKEGLPFKKSSHCDNQVFNDEHLDQMSNII